MLEEIVGDGTEPGVEVEEMVVILKLGPRYAEERLSSDELKDKAAETPDVKGFVNGSGENQLGSSKPKWCNEFCGRMRKEICCSKEVSTSTEVWYETEVTRKYKESLQEILTAPHVG